MEFGEFRAEDTRSVVSLLQQGLPGDPISEARFVRQVLLDANFRPAGARVARVGSLAVGFCLAIARHVPLENAPSDADRGYLPLLVVHPAHRRHGIAARLLADAEAYLSDSGRTSVLVSPYAPGYFIPGAEVGSAAEAFFQAHGYERLYEAVSMETALWRVEEPAWVRVRAATLEREGVHIERYRSEWTLPLLEFVRAEFPGDWVRVVRETMGRIAAGESPGRLQFAQDQRRVLGFVHIDNERFGPIGVAAAERGRAIGQALMFAGLRAIQEGGFRTAWFLWSDDRTARRLYDSAGFHVARRFSILRKALEPARQG